MRIDRKIFMLLFGLTAQLWGLGLLNAKLANAAEGDFIAMSSGIKDATAAIQSAVDSGVGDIQFPKGIYRITRTILIDLDRVGPTSLIGFGTARIVMEGSGPAFRFVGTHEGTASPNTVKDDVWQRQRTPMVDGIEIVGGHPEASGIEAMGTMQLTVTRTTVREALHGIHLVKRNRNVIISECHIYSNRGIGVFLDGVNLHQINVVNSHISYNAGGGVVVKDTELRNLQIGSCDIEGNMGGPDSEPTANVWIDSTGNNAGEIEIVGCTIQHSHKAPDSRNILIESLSAKRPYTDERKDGNITIADNVLSDVQVNIEILNTRSITITGNTMWMGYSGNLIVKGCENFIVSDNVFDRNPRYFYSDAEEAKLGVLFEDCDGGVINGNHIRGVGDIPAAMTIRNSRQINMSACNILDFGKRGLVLKNVSDSIVSNCLIRENRSEWRERSIALSIEGGKGNMVSDNLFGNRVIIEEGVAHLEGNLGRESNNDGL